MTFPQAFFFFEYQRCFKYGYRPRPHYPEACKICQCYQFKSILSRSTTAPWSRPCQVQCWRGCRSSVDLTSLGCSVSVLTGSRIFKTFINTSSGSQTDLQNYLHYPQWSTLVRPLLSVCANSLLSVVELGLNKKNWKKYDWNYSLIKLTFNPV